MTTDIAVIGGGSAGLIAAPYAVRAGKSVTVYARECIGTDHTRNVMMPGSKHSIFYVRISACILKI